MTSVKSNIGGEINPLFAIPLYSNFLNRPFHEHEHQCFGDVLKGMKHNFGNLISVNSQVLDDERLKDLKSWFMSCVRDYFANIIVPKYNVEPYITTSWINHSTIDEYHHIHHHPNSIISAVFYINADENSDKITFHKDEHNTIDLSSEDKDYNCYNSNAWSSPVQTGEILLFPSSLKHSVKSVTSNESRISLSFNVFVKGIVGSDNDKAFLELK